MYIRLPATCIRQAGNKFVICRDKTMFLFKRQEKPKLTITYDFSQIVLGLILVITQGVMLWIFYSYLLGKEKNCQCFCPVNLTEASQNLTN